MSLGLHSPTLHTQSEPLSLLKACEQQLAELEAQSKDAGLSMSGQPSTPTDTYQNRVPTKGFLTGIICDPNISLSKDNGTPAASPGEAGTPRYESATCHTNEMLLSLPWASISK